MKITLQQRYTFDSQTDRIGKSDFSKVYRAFDEMTKKQVALKFVSRSNLPEQYNISAEVKRALSFNHPNLVKYMAFFETKGSAIEANETYDVGVMEYVNGGDLNAFLKTFPSEDDIKHVFSGLLEGLSYLHQNHIVHRDIKPMNVMIEYDANNQPTAKIIDFGISKNVQQNAAVSNIIGTFEYMAPEQFDPKASISPQTDIWSFGVLLYEIFTNQMPFGSRRSGDADSKIIAAILNQQTPNKLHTIPQPYQSVIELCLVKNAKDRAPISQLLGLLQGRIAPPIAKKALSDTPTNLIQNPVNVPPPTNLSPPPTILNPPPTYVTPPTQHVYGNEFIDNKRQQPTPPVLQPADLPKSPVYTKAPLFRRFVASFIDGMIFGIPYFIGVILLVMVYPEILVKAYPSIFADFPTEPVIYDPDDRTKAILIGLVLLLIGLFYDLMKDGFGRGQSWGKRAMDLMVVDLKTNKPCTKNKSLVRNLILIGLNLVPYIGWLIEPIAVLADDDGRRLGDKAAGVMVIQTSEYN